MHAKAYIMILHALCLGIVYEYDKSDCQCYA